ncbi:hypothetical protein [Candidatus Regiella endosymbiont of Tuberolachnus salignus]|uniref:hypothetical protein n=1 Tax=Candidatus Regiella endosymbiont of Tuberolachnus salignus TaxID=3077956 RepID=UPI0030D25093
MLISLMALSPQRKLHSGLSGQIKLAIYGLLSLALTLGDGILLRHAVNVDYTVSVMLCSSAFLS